MKIYLDSADCLFKIPVNTSIDTTKPVLSVPSSPCINSIHRYSTVQMKTAAAEVDFWHHIIGHCDITTLVSMAEPDKVSNFPAHLTPAVIRSHFPISCPGCPTGNLQRRYGMYFPTSPPNIGREFEIDCKGK